MVVVVVVVVGGGGGGGGDGGGGGGVLVPMVLSYYIIIPRRRALISIWCPTDGPGRWPGGFSGGDILLFIMILCVGSLCARLVQASWSIIVPSIQHVRTNTGRYVSP